MGKLLESHLMEETYSKWPEWQGLCLYKNSDPKGLSAPVPGLYTYIKDEKWCIKLRLQRYFFETCNKWAKWLGFSVDIRILSTRGCLPLPWGYIGIPVMRYERAARPCALNFRLVALKCRFGRPPNALSSIRVWPSMPPLCAAFIQNVITLTGHLFIGKKCGVSKHSYLSINLKLFR